jgi:hypothetical protein
MSMPHSCSILRFLISLSVSGCTYPEAVPLRELIYGPGGAAGQTYEVKGKTPSTHSKSNLVTPPSPSLRSFQNAEFNVLIHLYVNCGTKLSDGTEFSLGSEALYLESPAGSGWISWPYMRWLKILEQQVK